MNRQFPEHRCSNSSVHGARYQETGTRYRWKEAYRLARILVASAPRNPDALVHIYTAFVWQAYLIVKYKREMPDSLLAPPLRMRKYIRSRRMK